MQRKILLFILLMTIALPVSAKNNIIVEVGEMNAARAVHTATLLPDGQVLITGGFAREGVDTASTEIYNPETEKFTPAASMLISRVGHAAVLLQDGMVLVMGGWSGTDLTNTAETYIPSKDEFTAVGEMNTLRGGFTATLLQDGQVLIAGGEDGISFHTSAELYDPATQKFTLIGDMNSPRAAHTATLLADGRVLITGGSNAGEILASAEIYDPSTQTFTPAAQMTSLRYKHGAVLLENGSVLLVGGSDANDWNGRLASAEIYYPDKNTFTLVAEMQAPRFKLADALVPLESGQILVIGGNARGELFDPASQVFGEVHGFVDAERFYMTATRLQDGNVLIVGGYDPKIEATHRAWLYLA